MSLSLLNLLQFPLMAVPMVLSAVVEANVSLNRIYRFLLLPELDPNNVLVDSTLDQAIQVTEGHFSWDGSNSVLSNIYFNSKKKELVSIVGRIGCGKTSFLSCLLGDMVKLQGKVVLNGSMSFVPQSRTVYIDVSLDYECFCSKQYFIWFAF